MKEIVTRPRIYKFWKKVEAFAVPKFQNGYTVNTPIAQEFKKMYGLEYDVIRNFPRLDILPEVAKNDKFILYQGAVNEGRSFETLIPAMKSVDCPLVICGDGNFMEQAKTPGTGQWRTGEGNFQRTNSSRGFERYHTQSVVRPDLV